LGIGFPRRKCGGLGGKGWVGVYLEEVRSTRYGG
jgi:hypothetical protein